MKISFFTLIFLFINLTTTIVLADEPKMEEDNSLSQDFVFEELICDQASKSKCERIKKEARFKSGEKISDKDLRNAKIRIQLLGLFKDVNLSLKKGSAKGKVVVAVETSDRSPVYTIMGLQAGYGDVNDSNGLEANADFTVGHRDIFGTGKNLSLSSRGWGRTSTGSTTGSALLRYSDPNLLGHRKWFLNFELFANKEDFNYLNADNFVGSLEIGRRYGDFSYWTVGYGKGYSKINRYYDESGTFQEDSLILGYGYNTQDDLYFPTSGSRINLKVAIQLDSSISNGLTTANFSNLLGNFDWRTTHRLDNKLFLTWFIEQRNNQLEQDDFLNDGLGFELGFQPVRNREGTDITDMRFYAAPSISSYSGFGGVESNLNVGVKLRSKSFGLVRLGLFGSHR